MPKSSAAKPVQSPRGTTKVRRTLTRSPLSRKTAEVEAAGGAGSTEQQLQQPTPGGKSRETVTRRSPRTAHKLTVQQSLKREADLTPASAKKVQRPTAPTPTRAAAIHAGSAHAFTQKAAARPRTTANPASDRRTPALRTQPARSPLGKVTPAPAVTPAAGLKAIATPATAAGLRAATTLKTHQRRRRSAATHGSAETPGAALEQHYSKAAAAQTAPAVVGAKRKARSVAEGAAAVSPGTALSPGSRKKRRATMPAGKGVFEVHADPEEIQYWKEVEQEELLTDSGDSSSAGAEEEEQNQQQQQRLRTKP